MKEIINKFLTEENKPILINRLKSLAWRMGNFAVVTLLAFVADNINLFHVSPLTQTVIALVTSEVTKYLNK